MFILCAKILCVANFRLGTFRSISNTMRKTYLKFTCTFVNIPFFCAVKAKLQYEIECPVGVASLPANALGGFAKLVKQPICVHFV